MVLACAATIIIASKKKYPSDPAPPFAGPHNRTNTMASTGATT